MTSTTNQLALYEAIRQAEKEIIWAGAASSGFVLEYLNAAKKQIDRAIEIARKELSVELPSPPAHGLRTSNTGTSEPAPYTDPTSVSGSNDDFTPAQFTPRGKAE